MAINSSRDCWPSAALAENVDPLARGAFEPEDFNFVRERRFDGDANDGARELDCDDADVDSGMGAEESAVVDDVGGPSLFALGT